MLYCFRKLAILPYLLNDEARMEIRRDAYLNELIIRMHNGMIKVIIENLKQICVRREGV